MNWSRIISVLTFVSTIIGLLAHFGGGFIPSEYMVIVLGAQAALLAFLERVQGGLSKDFE